jgi:hypothetical protein
MRDYIEQLDQHLTQVARAETRRGPAARFASAVATTPRCWIAIAATGGAAVIAALALSAGTTPTPAQAFPILKQHPIDVTSVLARGVRTSLMRRLALEHARAFAAASGTAYVTQTSNGLCVVVPNLVPNAPPAGQQIPAGATGTVWGCASLANMEREGQILTLGPSPGAYEFVAMVPVGGSVDLTLNGTTTTVPVNDDGIASGIVHENATVSVHVGNSNLTTALGPNANPPLHPPLGESPTGTGAATPTGATTATS